MSAILRYLFVKSWRDRSLIAFSVFTAGSILIPRVAIALVEAFRGRHIVEEGWVRDLVPVSAAASMIMATMAAFWVLRQEIGDRSIASIVLAARASVIAVAVTIYATLVGLASLLFALPIVGIHMPRELGSFGGFLGIAVCTFVIAGSLGLAMATISPEPPMLVPAFALAALLVGTAFNVGKASTVAVGGVLVTAILLTISSRMMERRCAG